MEHSSDKRLDADKALVLLGSCGLYQQCVFWLANFVWVFVGFQLMSVVFTAAKPPYMCYKTSEMNSSFNGNGTWNPPAQCILYDNSTGSMLRCGDANTTIAYDPAFGHTIVTDWHLICGKAHLSEMAASLFFLGYLLGSVGAPSLSDKFGRRRPLLVALFGLSVTGTALSFAPNYAAFAILRVLGGIFTASVGIVGWVAACEVVPPAHRAYSTLGQGIWWSTGYTLVGVAAVVLPDWRPLTLALGLACFSSIVYYWLMPESLHWYVAQNRTEDAKRWIERAARFNKIDVDFEECFSEVDHKVLKDRSLLELCKSPLLLIQTLIMAYLWFANCFIYYGLSLFTTRLAGDRHLNYILSGLVELPAYIFLSISFAFFGRKPTLCVFNTAASVTLFAALFVTAESADDDVANLIVTALWLFGKFSISITFMGIWLYGAEIFPTTTRSTGVGICNMAARMGGIIAPFVGLMSEISSSIPPIAFGIVSLIAALLVLLLPETNKKPLPDDVYDIDPGPVLSCLKK